MIRAIRYWLDKQKTSPGLLRSGQFRVLYNDGLWSVRMTYDAAAVYAEVFGGAVRWVRYEDPALTTDKQNCITHHAGVEARNGE